MAHFTTDNTEVVDCFLPFQNAILCHATRVNAISIMPIRKVRSSHAPNFTKLECLSALCADFLYRVSLWSDNKCGQ